LKNRFADAGLELDVIEDRPPLDDAILGREGRDEQIETVKTLLRNMGRVGIDVWCYVWMAPLKVLRTSRSVRGRGGPLVTRYDHAQMQQGPELEGATEDELRDSLEYFLDEVVPVAEEAGVKLALHPDDPPTGSIRGVDRIVTSVENYERILALHDSEHHGITFCQGNFAAMGADVPAAIRRFDDRIHFAHVRDVEGDAERFTEVWHDEGPTDADDPALWQLPEAARRLQPGDARGHARRRREPRRMGERPAAGPAVVRPSGTAAAHPRRAALVSALVHSAVTRRGS